MCDQGESNIKHVASKIIIPLCTNCVHLKCKPFSSPHLTQIYCTYCLREVAFKRVRVIISQYNV